VNPGTQSIADVVAKSVTAWFQDNASSLGAALAFYTLFSVAPILIIAVSIAGYVFGDDNAQTQVLAQLQDLVGEAGATAIRGLLASAHYSDKKGLAAAIGVITVLVGATSVFGELQNALGRIWQTPPNQKVGGGGVFCGAGFCRWDWCWGSAFFCWYRWWPAPRWPRSTVGWVALSPSWSSYCRSWMYWSASA
jgi:uncharacterized BrkB/YihY/UPF0761 family membrane protein